MKQEDFIQQIGANIRIFRKLRHLTQQNLADKLQKSLACISKYEKGTIAIDIYTLYEVASVLNVPVQLLLPEAEAVDFTGQSGLQSLPPFFQKTPIYAYCTRSTSNSVMSMAIDIQASTHQATIYCDLRDPLDYKTCHYILCGHVTCSEACVLIYCLNPILNGDFLLIGCSKVDLIRHNMVCFCASLSTVYRFRASKMYLSKTPIQDPDSLLPLLKMSKEDLSNSRKTNHFSI